MKTSLIENPRLRLLASVAYALSFTAMICWAVALTWRLAQYPSAARWNCFYFQPMFWITIGIVNLYRSFFGLPPLSWNGVCKKKL